MTFIVQMLSTCVLGIIGALLICFIMIGVGGVLFLIGSVYHTVVDHIKEKYRERRQGRASAR